MSSITTIQGTDVIATSRTDINTNFSNLNTDKIETSVIDTDTSLTANSDSKIPSQKAVKAYVDSGGQANASETVRGLVQEATAAQVTAGTDTGSTGAKLFVPPSKMNTQIDTKIAAATPDFSKVVGSLPNTYVKTYFNAQMPFILATGASAGDLTTSIGHWVRNSTDVGISVGALFLQFGGTGPDSIRITAPFKTSATTNLQADSTNIIIMDWWAKLPATSTGDINMGFGYLDTDQYIETYNNSSGSGKITFSMRGSTGVIYATMYKNGVGVTNTDVSSGVTNTNWNNFRIEYDIGVDAKFYINGTLVATLSGANMVTAAWSVDMGFGRSNTAAFAVTAPNISMQMNP